MPLNCVFRAPPHTTLPLLLFVWLRVCVTCVRAVPGEVRPLTTDLHREKEVSLRTGTAVKAAALWDRVVVVRRTGVASWTEVDPIRGAFPLGGWLVVSGTAC